MKDNHDFIENALQGKNLRNILHEHYREKRTLALMPAGRSNRRLVALIESDRLTFFDRMLSFVLK